MSYSIIPTQRFKKEAKQLLKKYHSLKAELIALENVLKHNPQTGKQLGNQTYKIRLSIKSKTKGKRGGARIITYLINENKEVYLLTIYDKSEFDSIDTKTLKEIIASL